MSDETTCPDCRRDPCRCSAKRPSKPRQVSYLYRCRYCRHVQRRGSSARNCEACKRKHSLTRMKTVQGPVKPTLKIVR